MQRNYQVLTFAGMIIAGGIVGYDHSTESWRCGCEISRHRSSREFSRDTVTVNMRLISVATGEVLLDVITSKTILSVAFGGDVFRYVEQGTRLVEIESGTA